MSDRENDLLETLEQGLRAISEAAGLAPEHYDRDQADIACYAACFNDAAGMIAEAEYFFDAEELGDFVSKKVQKIRNALATYMAAEGCSCCRDTEAHELAEKELAELLGVPAYEDGFGHNFSKFEKGAGNE